MTAILIHGTPDKDEYFDPQYPSPSNSHWFPWLQKELLIKGYETQTPEMPVAYRPDYGLWSAEFEKQEIGERSLLVGHSCGGGFLVRWLSEHKRVIARVVLVAPWMDPGRTHCAPGFFDFTIDPELGSRCDLHVVYSDNDSEEVNYSVGEILRVIPKCKKHLMPGRGHFCTSDLGSEKFLELSNILVPG